MPYFVRLFENVKASASKHEVTGLVCHELPLLQEAKRGGELFMAKWEQGKPLITLIPERMLESLKGVLVHEKMAAGTKKYHQRKVSQTQQES